jgi:predicted site-specific integrase-resolvase
MNTQLDAPAQSPAGASGFVSLADWRKKKGRSRSTIYRWRREGVIRKDDVRQLYGKLYISNEGIAHVDSLIGSQELAKPLHGCAAVSQSTREQQREDLARDNGAEVAALMADEEFKARQHP